MCWTTKNEKITALNITSHIHPLCNELDYRDKIEQAFASFQVFMCMFLCIVYEYIVQTSLKEENFQKSRHHTNKMKKVSDGYDADFAQILQGLEVHENIGGLDYSDEFLELKKILSDHF